MKKPDEESHEGKEMPRPPKDEKLLKPKKALIGVLVLLCLGAVAFLIARAFRGGQPEPSEKKLESAFVEKELEIEESAKAYNERAVEVAEGLIKEFPGRPEPIFLLGHVHYEQDNFDQAVKVWEEGMKIDSSRPDAYQAMGLMALQEGDYNRAIVHWRKALEVDPDWPGTRRAIGLALMHLGRIEDAVPELEADLEVFPNSAQTHFLLGQAFFQLGKLKEAKKHYESAIESNPRFTSAYYGLSKTFARLGQKEAAEDPLKKFQELKAGERKAKREGEEAYDDMVAQRGGLARTYDRAGMIYRAYGKAGKAMDHFRIAAKLEPMNVLSRFHLADLYESQGEIKNAIRVYEEMSRAHPRDVRASLSLGNLYAREGQFSNAEESFRRVMQFAPGHPIGYRELATLYFSAKVKLNVAEALARKALDLDPSAANYDLVGWAYYLNGKFTEAEAAAKKATELDPDNRIYRNHYETIRARR